MAGLARRTCTGAPRTGMVRMMPAAASPRSSTDSTAGYRARLLAIDKTVHLAQVQARIEREALTAEMARTLADLRRTIGWSAARAAAKLTGSVEYYMTLEDGTGSEPSQLIEAYDLLHACWAALRTSKDPP